MLGSGHPVAAEAFDLELYQLACVFAASRELIRVSDSRPGIRTLCRTFQQSEAARRLVSIAAMTRTAMDTWSTAGARDANERVGVLIPDTDRDERKRLTFREACNKVLHADHIELLDDTLDDPLEALRYEVVLEGQGRSGRKGAEWRATVNVLDFLEVASRVA